MILISSPKNVATSVMIVMIVGAVRYTSLGKWIRMQQKSHGAEVRSRTLKNCHTKAARYRCAPPSMLLTQASFGGLHQPPDIQEQDKSDDQCQLYTKCTTKRCSKECSQTVH